MEIGKLTVNRRHETGKGVARQLRAQGLVPGICYGQAMEEPIAVTVDPKALRKSLDPDKKDNTVLQLTVQDNGSSKDVTVMIRDFQLDPIRHDLSHVDLVAIDPDREIELSIPVELVGKPAGLVHGGTIHFERHDLAVSCKPADIPAKIVVDITPLDLGDVIHVSDIELPKGVRTLTDSHLSIVSCVAPEQEEAPAEAEAAAPAEKKDEKK